MPVRTVTGIDIGSDAIKIVQLRKAGDLVEVVKAGSMNVRASRPSEPEDGKEVGESYHLQVGERLRDLLRSLDMSPRSATTAVGGRRVVIRYNQLPFARKQHLRLMMEYQIESEAVGGAQQNAADYRPLAIPLSKDLHVMIGLAKNEVVQEQMDILESANVKAADVTLTPLPVSCTFAYGTALPDDPDISCIVNIGRENTDIVIQRGKNVYFARNITIGSGSFTASLASEFKINTAEAEEMKRAEGELLPDLRSPEGEEAKIDIESEEVDFEVVEKAGREASARQKRISDALRRAGRRLASQIQASVTACRSATGMSTLKIDKLYLTGGGTRLKGLDDFLCTRLRAPVEVMDVFAGIGLSKLSPEKRRELETEQGQYAVATGLALQQLFPEAFHLSLLPKRVKERQDFLSRRIYLWAAAALYAATMIGAIIWSSVLSDTRQRVVDQKGQVATKAEQLIGKATRLRDENVRLTQEMEILKKRLFAGKNVLALFGFMTEATPDHLRITDVDTYTERTNDRLERGKPAVKRLAAHLALIKGGQSKFERIVTVEGEVLNVMKDGVVHNERVVDGPSSRPIPNEKTGDLVSEYKDSLKDMGLFTHATVSQFPAEKGNWTFRIELSLKPEMF